MLFGEPGHRYNAFDQFSMVLALVLGTAGLPHILNRYYTNPSGVGGAPLDVLGARLHRHVLHHGADRRSGRQSIFIKDCLAGGGSRSMPRSSTASWSKSDQSCRHSARSSAASG